MAITTSVDIEKLKELRKSNPTKAKNFLKKLKKKNAKKIKQNKKNSTLDEVEENTKEETSILNDETYVEYVEEDIDEALYENFEDVFKKFKLNSKDGIEKKEFSEDAQKSYFEDSESDDNDEEDEHRNSMKYKKNISKKAKKLLKRPSVMKLKEFAPKPELVEVWDTTSSDPYFYVWIKCLKNSIPVPQQWCQKRKYLHGKRGIEKIPYRLPPHIEDTKISEIRQAIKEKEEQKSLKQKMRDRVRPKLHTMDIDYQTLHDAFFKYATKPKLVKFAEVYYEGKEYELKKKKFRPGIISEKLRIALNIEPNEPLPWLINMQKYGLPPSFPYLKIPGLNVSSPNDHTSDMAKNIISKDENIDESGNIIYGNFISQHVTDSNNNKYADDFLWGEMDDKYEDEDDAQEEQEENDEEANEEEDNEEDEDEEEDDEVDDEKDEDNEETYYDKERDIYDENEDNINNIEGKVKKKKKKGKKKNIKQTDNNDYEHMDHKNTDINLNPHNEELLKNNYSSGIYSVMTNSKMNTGSYTPYMESGITSVDLTSFISGYDTPKYLHNNNNYINTTNMKPYTILQKEDIPIEHNNLFSSNVRYKINPPQPPPGKPPNLSEGYITPYTNVNTPKTPYVHIEIPNNAPATTTNIEDVRKELNKFEEISNKVKMVSAQIDPPKKEKKDEKQKKKKKDFKF
ncbi:splicing factor 3B subunit 2, putative [Plasmodium gaboni]|uniref:Splicing factor 3B subunit 2, putative n=1 Tax=Plasmodium gaboni TaxID=647221 RepID=A0ABY1UUV1_9APIC|nr:splicing factor 3B subunit 2, putative [Plasmodium gaboni]